MVAVKLRSLHSLRLLAAIGVLSAPSATALGRHQSLYTKVSATVSEPIAPPDADTSTRYLVASFPDLRQVAYVHLPDNVWRPLAVGNIGRPDSVALDGQHMRLFVSDPPQSVIWWYSLMIRPDGFLMTDGPRHAAVENFVVGELAVSGQGDLYFTGYPKTAPNASAYNCIFRQDAVNLRSGISQSPVEVYSRSDSGSPDPKVWLASGVAVDAMNIYWGNQEQGMQYGSIVRGSRKGLGLTGVQMPVAPMNMALNKTISLASTGTHIFWLSPEGVYSMLKTTSQLIRDPKQGLVAKPPVDGKAWNPRSIAWDGENTLYLSDTSKGVIYSLPSLSDRTHSLTKFADVPGVLSLAVMSQSRSSRSSSTRSNIATAFAVMEISALLIALL